jgi:proline iminopeptidase
VGRPSYLSVNAGSGHGQPVARSGYLSINGTELYVREVGEGRPVIVLHGGPDFDHNYLLPEMDRLAGSCRLIYYDQRGRGRSAGDVKPEEVTLGSEMADLDHLRRHFQLDSVGILGHSWGGLMAMEYATRHPDRVSHLILLNTAPASGHDAARFRQLLRASRTPSDIEMMEAISSSDRYQAGSIQAELDYYRIHFRGTVSDPAQLEQILGRLRSHFTPGGVRTAREIEQRLYEQTWSSADYDLFPRLRELNLAALVLHGDHDFVPVEIAAAVAAAIPGSRFTLLRGCGHFSYVEHPEQVHEHVAALIRGR